MHRPTENTIAWDRVLQFAVKLAILGGFIALLPGFWIILSHVKPGTTTNAVELTLVALGASMIAGALLGFVLGYMVGMLAYRPWQAGKEKPVDKKPINFRRNRNKP